MSDLITMMSAAAGQAGEDTDPFFNQTTLLLHGDGTNGAQNNTFLDSSTNNFTITRNGNTTQGTFSPFLPSAAYDPSVNGGSGLFGTGNYLTAPDDNAWDLTASTGSIEMFLYSTGIQANGNGLVGQNSATGDWGGYVYADGRIAIGIQGSSELVTASGNLVDNTWIHVVFTRDNSTGRTRTFVNGVLKATGTGTYFAVSSNPLQIINFNDGVNRSFIGYVADIRFCKGSIPTDYQTASTTVDASIFTPPTAPLTVSSQGATSADTELLLNFTNAGIFDNTGKNNLQTVGNAQIDTTTKKYGTGSIEFDGTGDWLLMPHSPDQQLGTGDFTIEFWVYLATGDAGSNRGLVAKGTSTTGFLVSLNTTEKVVFTFTTSTITSTGAITLDAWNHIAVVREGTGSNETKIYIGGTNDGTGTVSTDFNQTSVMYVGANRTGGDPMKGYIDDLRITKGVARYTTTFTPPSRAFPDL